MSHKTSGNDKYSGYRHRSNRDNASSRKFDNGNNRNRKRSRSPQNSQHGDERRHRDRSTERYGTRPYGDGRGGGNRDYRNRNNRNECRRDFNSGINSGRPSWENNKVRRHAEGIQQRKLLWSKPKEGNDGKAENNDTTLESSSCGLAPKALESAWTSRLAAATTDSKQMDKFQRLMGMKKTTTDNADDNEGNSVNADDHESDKSFLDKERKRQAELTAQLDRQYAMARATTHLGRGKGLGFNG